MQRAALAFGLVIALAMAFGAFVYVRTAGPSRAARGPRSFRDFVSLGSDQAIEYDGGIGGPLLVSAVQRRGNTLTTQWSWNGGTNNDVYLWQWVRRGSFLAAQIHRAQGEGAARLAVFDARRGLVTTVDGLADGAFDFADEHVVVAVAGGSVRLIDAAQPGGGPDWHVARQAAGNYVVHAAGTALHAIVWDGTLQVFDRANAGSQRVIAPMSRLVGIVSVREEALVTRDGRLAVIALADGSERMRVELIEGSAVPDDMDSPCLFGVNAGNWIVMYPTTLVASAQVNGASWSVPSAKVLAAIDPATGRVAWRAPLGNWDMRCTENPFVPGGIATDRALVSPLVVRGEADVQGGRGHMRGLLASIELTSGAISWRTEFDRGPGSNAFDAYRGDAFYTRADDRNVLLRFERGRLTGAVRMGDLTETLAPQSVADNAVWISGESWQVRAGADLRVVGAAGDRAEVADARAAALVQYALPPAAR